MTSKILSRRDIAFLLYEWLDVESLTKRPRYADHSRETFDAALQTCEDIATDLFEPHNKKSDQNEPHFDGERVTMIPEVAKALKAFNDAGLMAAGRDYELGGMQLPAVVEKAGFAWFKAANVGTSSYPFLTIGNSNLLLAHGSDEQVEQFVKPMMTGRFFGTMCLSETQAGSSLSDVKTRAVPQDDGTYRLFGNKMWISAGEHDLSENIVHLVLAKIPEADGVAAARREGHLAVHRAEVPRGGRRRARRAQRRRARRPEPQDGLPRHDELPAELRRGSLPARRRGGRGRLPGRRAEPWPRADVPHDERGAHRRRPRRDRARLHRLPARARLCAQPSAGPSATAARTRRSRRCRSSRMPTCKRMLLAQKSYVEGALALNLYCAKLVDDERTAEDESIRREAKLLLDILTPIAKSWPSQWCLEANNLAIQVHGGYGYTRDYNVEQFYRDNRLNPIHEGTHGIQGLDLLGRKVVMQGGAAMGALTARVRDTIARCRAIHDPGSQRLAGELDAQWTRLEDVTKTLHAAGDANRTLANATVYLEAFGHLVVAWMWLEQALVAGRSITGTSDHEGGDDAFYFGKLAACRYFFAYEVPKVGPMLDLLASLDTTTLTMQDAWF